MPRISYVFSIFHSYFHGEYNFKNETIEQIVHFFQLLIDFVKESHKKKHKIEQLVLTIINHSQQSIFKIRNNIFWRCYLNRNSVIINSINLQHLRWNAWRKANEIKISPKLYEDWRSILLFDLNPKSNPLPSTLSSPGPNQKFTRIPNTSVHIHQCIIQKCCKAFVSILEKTWKRFEALIDIVRYFRCNATKVTTANPCYIGKHSRCEGIWKSVGQTSRGGEEHEHPYVYTNAMD